MANNRNNLASRKSVGLVFSATAQPGFVCNQAAAGSVTISPATLGARWAAASASKGLALWEFAHAVKGFVAGWTGTKSALAAEIDKGSMGARFTPAHLSRCLKIANKIAEKPSDAKSAIAVAQIWDGNDSRKSSSGTGKGTPGTAESALADAISAAIRALRRGMDATDISSKIDEALIAAAEKLAGDADDESAD